MERRKRRLLKRKLEQMPNTHTHIHTIYIYMAYTHTYSILKALSIKVGGRRLKIKVGKYLSKTMCLGVKINNKINNVYQQRERSNYNNKNRKC